MIVLDEHRKANLEMAFQGVPDRDLIQELVRRGRFLELQYSVAFWPEMRESDGYMDNIRERALRGVARGLDKHAALKPALVTERPADDMRDAPDVDGLVLHTNHPQGILEANVVVLTARDKKEN